LDGRRAVVTGGSGAIGSALSAALYDAGANVAIIGRSDSVYETAASVGMPERPIHGIRCDLTDRDALPAGFAEAVEMLGGIDILVACHGMVQAGEALSFDLGMWDETIESNLNSVFSLCQLAGASMLAQGYGKIVTFASMLSFGGGLRAAAYAASKGGVAQLTKALANEWSSKGINVNAIAPGYIKTKLNQHIWTDPVRNEQILARLPSGRWGDPADLKGPVVLLTSSASDYVHGIVLPVDGGWLARWDIMKPDWRFTRGIDSFAYHRYFGEHTRWETPLDFRWTTQDFIERARQLNVDGVSLQTCYLPALTEPVLNELQAQLGNLSRVLTWGHPDGLRGEIAPEAAGDLMALLPNARALGCRLVRFVAENHFFFHLNSGERIQRLVPVIREIAQDAARQELDLALENHADFVMRDLLTLIERLGASNLGICLDTGNAARVGDDPVEATRLAAPLVKMVHLKDLRVQADSRGDPTAWWPSAPLGQGDFDIPAILNALCDGGYQAACSSS
jgi:2-deoxy-D-gluconate 3-dehydrogenase